METTLKRPRWIDLTSQQRASQFVDRGIERSARNEIRPLCSFCEKSILEGDSYYDINGAKYAHKSCVSSHKTNSSKPKLVTHKMMQEASAKKTAEAAAAQPAKRGRKPKVQAAKVLSDETGRAKRGRKPKSSPPVSPKAVDQVKGKRGRKPKSAVVKAVATAPSKTAAKRGPKPKTQKPEPVAANINLSEVREALPGAIVTLTITGTVEAVQRALDKLQN